MFRLLSFRYPHAIKVIDNYKNEIKKTNLEDKECIICLESIDYDLHILICKHHFHEKCIYEWIKRDESCPQCRHKIRLVIKQKKLIYDNCINCIIL